MSQATPKASTASQQRAPTPQPNPSPSETATPAKTAQPVPGLTVGPYNLNAKNFMGIVQDPSRTVVVFFHRDFPEAHPFVYLSRELAGTLLDTTGITIALFDVGRREHQSLFEFLQQSEGPVKKNVPRIVVYPKGFKEGIKFKGLPGGDIPSAEHLKGFVLHIDQRHPARTPLANPSMRHNSAPVAPPKTPSRSQPSSPRRLSVPPVEHQKVAAPKAPQHPKPGQQEATATPSKLVTPQYSQPTPKAIPKVSFAEVRKPAPMTRSRSAHVMPTTTTTMMVPVTTAGIDLYGRLTGLPLDPLPKPTGTYKPPSGFLCR